MSDFISRKAAIIIVCDDACDDCPDGGCDIYRRLKRLPAADVRPVVRGKWVQDQNNKDYFSCSCCHEEIMEFPSDMGYTHYDYCPNCGADLREEGNNG